MKKSLSINLKLILSFVVIFITAIILSTLITQSKYKGVTNDIIVQLPKTIMTTAVNLLEQQAPGNWEEKDGKIYKGNLLMNNNTEVVDYISKKIGANVTIFQDNIRISTNVLKEDGKTRAVGTEGPPQAKQTYTEGKPFYGQVTLVTGKSFMAGYIPIKDANGKILGMYFIGLPIGAKLPIDTLLNQVHSVFVLNYIINGIFIIIGVGIIYMVIRKINKPLELAAAMIKSVAEGDLTKRIKVNSYDEIGQLLTQINVTSENLDKMIRNIKNSSNTVLRASEEITAGNQDLSQRTQEQATSLEETSASIEELTATVKNNADNANKANSMSAKTKEIVTEGNYVVKETIQAMDAVTHSSKKISEIINVVNEIAFQTNLLALNAAVEAARAGEQGRGFAVVAVEVRNLAQRSADAAKEIQGLINDSVEKIQNGNELVLKTGSTLDKITESIENMAGLISEISAASQEQSVGIEEVNRAIVQMDQVTQQNAALVEESAATSEMMARESNELYSFAAQFKLSEEKEFDDRKDEESENQEKKLNKWTSRLPQIHVPQKLAEKF